MNIVDILIILGIVLFGVTGMKRGGIRQIVGTVGFIIVLILAFNLKNPLAEFLSLHLPFFKFGGVYHGVTALNILFYQLIAFFIILALLEVVLKLVLAMTGVLEKLLRMTVILALPSKILGLVAGLIEGFLVIFIILLVFHQPMFNIKAFNESKLTDKILKSTPLMSGFADGIVTTVNDIYEVGKGYTDQDDSETLNREAIEIMLKHKVITADYVSKLVDAGKIDVLGIDNIINQYR